MKTCEVCGEASETVKHCSWCGADIGDCCRYKPATRAWAAARRALKGTFGRMFKGKAA